MALPLYQLGVVFILLWLVNKLFNIGKRDTKLPPGPPTIPILGNLHIFPTKFAHFRFTEWAREYGEIYSLKIGPGTAIVISSATAVKELMDKRSASTVDRPANRLVLAVTGGYNIAFARYTEVWRTLRKAAHTILSPQASNRHLPMQKAEAIQLMYDLLKDPEAFYNHIRRYSNSVIMCLLYGTRSPRYETKQARALYEVQHLWEQVLAPGAHPPVDLLPFLEYIPERWAPWKRLCKLVRSLQRDLYFELLDECEKRMKRGEGNGCYIEELLERQDALGMDRELIGYLAGALSEGGSDTTASFLQSLALALVAFPGAQSKAQEELDRVIGDKRLPSLEDFENLPYIQAIVKETHRFRPVTPLAIPHANLVEEEYNGYVIPEGTTIFVNIWGVYHDPDAFEDPEIFNPDRFLLTEHGTKPGFDASDFRTNLPFGTGRRICPGIPVANNSLMLNTMNLLWGFDFSLATDSLTKAPIPVNVFDYQPELLQKPAPFKCNITPRSKERAALIKREFIEAIATFSRFEDGLSAEEKEWLVQTRVM
ncbi:cytochrome P450 [Mycena floridula]|nr:cytochrome P450 [Mycena floridula]